MEELYEVVGVASPHSCPHYRGRRNPGKNKRQERTDMARRTWNLENH